MEDAAPSAWTEGRLLSIYWHNRSNALFVFAGSSNGYRYVCRRPDNSAIVKYSVGSDYAPGEIAIEDLRELGTMKWAATSE